MITHSRRVEEPTSRCTVAVVDDDPNLCVLVERWIRTPDTRVEIFGNAEDCLDGLARFMPDCLLLDLGLPGMSGMEALKILRTRHPDLPIVMLTAETGVESVVEAMRLGAYDYLTKPMDKTQLLKTIRNATVHQKMAVRLVQLEREVSGEGVGGMIGESTLMKTVFRQLTRAARTDVTVLIRGESGTGKELVARALHDQSGRSSGPLECVNCAAIPDNLQESELFGHERGAFTGASSRYIGRFERSNGGTLFMDELGDLSLSAQAKVLRAIQEGRFQRVGGTEEIRSDFRLIAATNRDLEGMMRAGEFREDLFFRVAVFELHLPPLRERKVDIPQLIDHFVESFTPAGEAIPTVSPAALGTMMIYDWPGNIRELQNAIQRALVTCEGEIRAQDLPARVRVGEGSSNFHGVVGGHGSTGILPLRSPSGPGPDARRHATLKDLERLAIIQAIDDADGNMSEVSRALGIGRTTLYRKLKAFGLR